MPDGTAYLMLGLDGENFGGAMEMSTQLPADMPSYWLVYFDVTDVSAAFDRAMTSGGSQIVPPSPMPGGPFALLRDPQGAAFGIAHSSLGGAG